jgi:hypothetical protein
MSRRSNFSLPEKLVIGELERSKGIQTGEPAFALPNISGNDIQVADSHVLSQPRASHHATAAFHTNGSVGLPSALASEAEGLLLNV